MSKFMLLPLISINDANTDSVLLRVNEEMKKTINKAKEILQAYGTSEIAIQLDNLEKDVIVLSNDFSSMNIDDNKLKIVTNLHLLLQKDEGVEIVVDFDNDVFDSLQQEYTVNWSENLRFILTENGFYLTNKFETDFLESIMLEYSDLD